MTGIFSKNVISTFVVMTFCLVLYYNDQQIINLGYSMPAVQYLPRCQCYRYHGQDTIRHSSEANISLSNTTCSEDAYYKGSHQKVISFTYFEPSESEEESVPSNKTNRDYFLGIKENLGLVRKFYPGYNMRLYYQVHSQIAQADLCHLGG